MQTLFKVCEGCNIKYKLLHKKFIKKKKKTTQNTAVHCNRNMKQYFTAKRTGTKSGYMILYTWCTVTKEKVHDIH